jgi:hypothetical protein
MSDTITQDEINSILWRAGDTFRSTVDPAEPFLLPLRPMGETTAPEHVPMIMHMKASLRQEVPFAELAQRRGLKQQLLTGEVRVKA